MNINFSKYHAHGNDFILIDHRIPFWKNRDQKALFSKKICHRNYGVGADGLLLLENHDQYDFEMVYYNPDGSISMCGNGARCIIHFAKELNIISSNTQFIHQKQCYYATIDNNMIHLQMPSLLKMYENSLDYIVHNGAKHYITFTDSLKNYDLKTGYYNMIKKKFYHYNFNVIQLVDPYTIQLRTYENGVFAETLSCGTGAVAAALVCAQKNFTKSPTLVYTQGGISTISYKFQKNKRYINQFSNIVLSSKVTSIFRGVYPMINL